jgi:hypothetical protein
MGIGLASLRATKERRVVALRPIKGKGCGINWIYYPILKKIACQVFFNKKRRGRALSSEFDS